MPKCVKKRIPVTEICAGDLRHKIDVYTKTLQAPAQNSVDFGVSLGRTIQAWAMIETTANESMFDGSNIEQTITHKFYIRYIPGVTFQEWVRFRGEYFSIIGTQDLQEENKYIVLSCNVRGDVNKKVNLV